MLKKVKANRYTYFNLNNATIEFFRNRYAFLKKYQDREVSSLSIMIANKIISKKGASDYVKKCEAMRILATGVLPLKLTKG